MKSLSIKNSAVLLALLAVMMLPVIAYAADLSAPGIEINFTNSQNESAKVTDAVKIIVGLTLLSLAPSLLIVMTSFIRIIVVLSMLRHAFGMQSTPPNSVLISLAIFLTVFNMMPVLDKINADAWQPYSENKISTEVAFDKGLAPLRDFMIRQTRENDLALMVELSHSEMPETVDEIKTYQLIPAFIISELKTAFQIGFVIFLPFLIVDLVVASILMSMGMLMVPPMMISLPVKILMFVLIDGWNIVTSALMNSFN